MYPTPSATVYGSSVNGILRHGGESEAGTERPRPGAGRPSLETMARKGLWPTPSAHDGKGSYRPGQRRYQLTEVAGPGRTPDNGRLSPDWVEWLMGWPIGWTDPGCDEPRPHPGWEIDPAELPEDDPGHVPRVVEHYKGRRERLKALGNGMVPQCARVGWSPRKGRT